MKSPYLDLAGQYFAGNFKPPKGLERDPVALERFEKVSAQFFQNHDDWYRDYYEQNGKDVDAVVALIQLASVAFQENHRHMPLCYLNCAISSGTNPHHDAVYRGYHTTDRLARLVGTDVHVYKNILDNSNRSLQRAKEVQDLLPSHYFVTPSALEGAMRVVSGGNGSKITGKVAVDGADYMSFWNMVIPACNAFILDDVRKDMPSLETVMKEIALAQEGSKETRPRKIIETSDWINSRNSAFECYLGNVVRFGLHPQRPDAKMDMYVFDDAAHSLQPATLADCVKPLMQNVLRWVPQGIAAEEVCRSVARLFNLHRMRTDPTYNACQIAPLELDRLDPLIANPRHDEVVEMDMLMRQFEPFLLKYCAHLIRPEGLPEKYTWFRDASPIKEKDIGDASVKWQRQNIPAAEVAQLWDITLPRTFKPEDALSKRPSMAGPYQPHRATHHLEGSPFDAEWDSKIWEDNPYPDLPEIQQDLVKLVIGVMECGLLPLDAPDYRGLVYDMKRGELARQAAEREGVDDISLLPGALGRKFHKTVKEPNQAIARQMLQHLRHDGAGETPFVVFGTPIISAISDAVDSLWGRFPGSKEKPDSNFRLSLAMKMMDRNETRVTFQDGWETSDDSARLMLRATLIEFGKIKRRFDGTNEMYPQDSKGNYIPFHDRYEKMRAYVEKVSSLPHIRKMTAEGDAAALEKTGIKHITLALARMMEIHDSFVDTGFDGGRFETHHMRHPELFKAGINKIQDTKDATRDLILDQWVWMWDPKDVNDTTMRQEYREKWQESHGQQARDAGPEATFTRAIKNRGGLTS